VAGEADLLAGDVILSVSFLFHYQSFQHTCHPHIQRRWKPLIVGWLAVALAAESRRYGHAILSFRYTHWLCFSWSYWWTTPQCSSIS